MPETKADLLAMVRIVRRLNQLSPEVHTEQLRSLTCAIPAPLVLAVIPLAQKGKSGFLNFKYWLEIFKKFHEARLPKLKCIITDM